MLDIHAAILSDAARALWGAERTPDPRLLTRSIGELLLRERIPREVSAFVRLDLQPEGEPALSLAGRSLYDGYALRSIRPEGVPIPYDIPFGAAPTLLREQCDLLADIQARRIRRGAVAVCCDPQGRCLRAEGAPLFAVRGYRVFTAPAAASGAAALEAYIRQHTEGLPAAAPAYPDAERTLALRAIRAAGLELREEAFTLEQAEHMDELFYVDHRGVTALAALEGVPYMSILAERIAAAMEGLFPKK